MAARLSECRLDSCRPSSFTGAPMSVSLAKALADGAGLPERTIEFSENLQVHDRLVSPVLRFIKANVAQGLEDEGWYEEQLHFLLERMRQLRDRTLL